MAQKRARRTVVVDGRCLQDPAYRQRGVGLHSRFVCEEVRAVAHAHDLVLLTSAELPPPDQEVSTLADRTISTPYPARNADVALFVELSPMTASIAPVVQFLGDEGSASVSVVYDFIPSSFPQAYLRSPAAVLTNRLRVEAVRRYDLLLPISEATANECRRLFGDAVDARATGVADPLHDVTPATVDVHRPYMLVPSGGDARKNPLAAIAALAMHRAVAGTALRAVVTGRLTGGHEQALRKLARRLGLPDEAVEIRGTVSSSELLGLYEHAELVFVPSFAEGFSIPVVEGVLRDVPVVASDIPPHRELVGTGPWLADPEDVESFAEAVRFVLSNRSAVSKQQRAHLGDTSRPARVASRVRAALEELLEKSSHRRHGQTTRTHARPRLAVISPFPPQRSGVADYSAFTFSHVAKYADVEVYSAAPPSSSSPLQVHPLSAAPYFDRRFDAVVNVIGNSHFHFPILDLMGAYGGACIAHDNRMVEAYRHDRGDAWTADLVSRPGRHVRPDELLGMINDLDRLPTSGYDIIARQASPLIVHGAALGNKIYEETGTTAVVVPFVPYNVPRSAKIGDETRSRARDALGLGPDTLHLGTFGIVDRRTKGLDFIVAALAWLRSWDIDVRLHVVGQAPLVERHALRRLARNLDVDDRLIIHGHASKETLEDFLLAVDIAVQLRTSDRLSLSGTLADCIAFGVPTVTTETIARELDAPGYVGTTPIPTSSLVLAEAILSLRDRRKTDGGSLEKQRRDYLERRSADRYARALLDALGLGSD
jgi:glycosyltransferase involved in cell wall biosynthesis